MDDPVERIVIAGGLSRDPAIPTGLAALLARPVCVLCEPESALLGAARLAAGLEPYGEPALREQNPGVAGSYLRAKYPRWQEWLRRQLRD